MPSTRLEDLDCFATVAELHSISAAARKIGVSQPTVSRRISNLEESLGIKLLIRESDGVGLTELGRRFLLKLNPALARVSAVMEEMKSADETMDGIIKVAALSAHGEAILVPRIISFYRQYPEVSFEIEFLKEVEIIQSLRDGTVEIGIITSVPEGNWLRVHRIADERAVLVSNFGNSKPLESISDLYRAKFIAYRNGDPLLDGFVKRHFKGALRNRLNVAFTVNSHRSMVDLLRTGDFYAVLPFTLVENAVMNQILRLASGKDLSGGIFVAYRADIKLTRRNRHFVEAIAASNKE